MPNSTRYIELYILYMLIILLNGDYPSTVVGIHDDDLPSSISEIITRRT